tara:strand:- start:2587 stop:4221 length:1635 start_codon:yes stop_codon:yes gene_type:complete
MKNFKSVILFPLLLVALIILLYHPVVNNGISGLDDLLMIEENWDKLTHLSHIYTAFTDDVFSRELGTYYRPIQILTYMPDAFIAHSPDPVWRIFFILNIGIFAVAMLLLYRFLMELKFSPIFSFVFTIFAILHPAFVPAVAWVPGRVDIVLFIFLISSLWAFIRYQKQGKSFWLFLHYLFFALGMFTKETTIVVPVISMLFVFYSQNKWIDSTQWKWIDFLKIAFWNSLIIDSFGWLKTHFKLMLGWALIVLLWFIMRSMALTDEPTTFVDLLYRLATAWEELIVMFSVLLIPFNLQVFLELTWGFVALAIPGFVLLLAIPKLIKTAQKDLVFGVLWIFLFLLPTTLSDYLNYHRLLIPMVGMAFILRPLGKLIKSSKKLYVFLLLGVFATLFIVENLKFQKAFTNRTHFWANAVKYSPNSAFANNGMAWSYHLNHQNDSALMYYQRVVEIRPDRENVRMGMALIYEEDGNTLKADSLLQAEFMATKDSSTVYFYIGQIELERKDTLAAVKNLILGYPATETSRNARMYYDTLDVSVKELIRLK